MDFLRNLLKDKGYIALSYMTGILPVKKYGTHSALNMFDEFSMFNPRQLAEFVGFTEEEVRIRCDRYRMDFEETKQWYDGYYFQESGSIYSPRSVVSAMLGQTFDNYWNQTESFEALRCYIVMNYDGLRDSIVELLAGGRVEADTRSFTNDMTTFTGRDDVLTSLIHLGYLAYDRQSRTVFIPNKEVADEYITATKSAGWDEITKSPVTVGEQRGLGGKTKKKKPLKNKGNGVEGFNPPLSALFPVDVRLMWPQSLFDNVRFLLYNTKNQIKRRVYYGL